MRAKTRIAVTGVGIVSALGCSQDKFWEALSESRCGIGPLTLFDPGDCQSKIAGQVELGSPGVGRQRRRLSRTDQFCLTAAREALQQARLQPGRDLEECGISLGCSSAGMLEAERVYAAANVRGWNRTPVAGILALPVNTPADVAASSLGLGGPRLSNMTACSSASLAIGLAVNRIRSGEVIRMLAGGGDALCRLTYSGFNSLRLLDPEPCRPFDLDRRGLSLGEGAGVLMLEHWDRALERGVKPLAELVDYGASCDAHHMTAAHPGGRGALAAMNEALARSAMTPSDVDYVNAHGTGTASNDSAEVEALLALFAGHLDRLTVSSTKSMVGHLLGGAGGVEAVTVVLALRRQQVPPTLGLMHPEGGGRLDFVPRRSRAASLRVALSNSFGFGGANSCLVFRRAEAA